MKENHLQVFLLEMGELLEEVEQTMLALEEDMNNIELIGRGFRAIHTMKGSSSMFGFERISSFLHKIENVYDLVRNGSLTLNSQIITLTLRAGDIIKKIIDNEDVNEIEINGITSQFASFLNSSSEQDINSVKSSITTNQERTQSNGNSKFKILFAPTENIFLTGTNPLLILRELADLGKTQINANIDVPNLDKIEPTLCYTKWEILLETDKDFNTIKDVFIFVEDDCLLEITAIKEDIIEEVAEKENSPTQIENLEKSDTTQSKKVATSQKDSIASIRVNSDKLDELVNLVGELVIVQARLTQIASKKNDLDLLNISEEVERLTWNLRDSTLNIRMLAIGTTFNKFKRLVRDLSLDLNKDVELTTSGGETEIDKTVIEKLNDPLIHIIRNSIDHGIESPDKRIANNKQKTGTIHLKASQSGGYVFIKISDDGAGLDRNKILQKAIEKGLAQPDKEYSDNEIYNFIFLPGFSTAALVTNVSGRGVGMDVVKRSIEGLRGTVEIDSELGKGTVVTCKLPLTLAIIEGLLVKVANDYFVIPLSQVEECVDNTNQKVFNKNGRSLIEIRGSLIPFISLHRLFELQHDENQREQFVIIKDSGYKIGITVDQIIGEQQVVIKSMGSVFKKVDSISGATILGDGSVALILDVLSLISKAEKDENSFTNNMFS